jgi:ATP/maltotriose-dependent transcriptional regulator MalT
LADFERAETAFVIARDTARDERDENEALHGVALANVFGERPGAREALAAVAARRDRTPVDFLRFVTADVALRRLGGEGVGLNSSLHVDAVKQTLPQADDPRARTSATYTIACALAQRGDYADAREWLAICLEDAARFDLEFTMPYANWTSGQIALGQRRFAEAERSLQAVEDAAAKTRDRHHELNARTLRARLLLQNGDTAGASECLRLEPDIPLIPSWLGEYLATRAVAMACEGRAADALETADRAERITIAVEVHVLAQVARAIAISDGSGPETRRLVELASRSGVWDPVVCGVRSSPTLAEALANDADTRPAIADLYRRTQDTTLARRAGLRTRATAKPSQVLSPREFEVLGLIALGYRNHDISRALFIADSTTKVHIRHILEKLGVRTRSEAVARFQMFEK